MKGIWDLLFDKLSKVTFTVCASKARKLETVTGARGRMADKVWRATSGIEIAWQEAAKKSKVLDMRKHTRDMRKVLKGTKDIIDFAIKKTGISSEMFAVVTSGIYLCSCGFSDLL